MEGQLFTDIFLGDFMQEEEHSPDEDKCDSGDDDNDSVQSASANASKKKGTKQEHGEKEDIVAHLEGIGDELIDSKEEKEQLHMHVYEDRLSLFRELTSKHVARLKGTMQLPD